MPHQSHTGVPARQCSSGGSGGQWEAEPDPTSCLCQWTGGVPDTAEEGIWDWRPSGRAAQWRIFNIQEESVCSDIFV